MTPISRRHFIQTGTAALALGAFSSELRAAYPKLKIGVTDWNLQHTAKSTSIEFA